MNEKPIRTPARTFHAGSESDQPGSSRIRLLQGPSRPPTLMARMNDRTKEGAWRIVPPGRRNDAPGAFHRRDPRAGLDAHQPDVPLAIDMMVKENVNECMHNTLSVSPAFARLKEPTTEAPGIHTFVDVLRSDDWTRSMGQKTPWFSFLNGNRWSGSGVGDCRGECGTSESHRSHSCKSGSRLDAGIPVDFGRNIT